MIIVLPTCFELNTMRLLTEAGMAISTVRTRRWILQVAHPKRRPVERYSVVEAVFDFQKRPQ